jgi:hypothetical protein
MTEALPAGLFAEPASAEREEDGLINSASPLEATTKASRLFRGRQNGLIFNLARRSTHPASPENGAAWEPETKVALKLFFRRADNKSGSKPGY